MQQPPSPQPTAKKKSSSGCLIALAIVGGLAVLVMAVVGFGVWRFASSKEGKAIIGAVGEMATIVAEAQSAPGAAEVRELGCDQAMVLDLDRMVKIFKMLDAGAPHESYSVMVICQVGVLHGDPPSCDRVASTYRAAVNATRPFAASVTRSGSHGEVCSILYDAKGNRVRDLPHGSTPNVPGAH
jgi:hypothetical protein